MHALGAKRRALHDAEPVLLVDDRQPQLAERDGILDERVCANHELKGSAGELRLHLAPLLGRGRPGQERHAEA